MVRAGSPHKLPCSQHSWGPPCVPTLHLPEAREYQVFVGWQDRPGAQSQSGFPDIGCLHRKAQVQVMVSVPPNPTRLVPRHVQFLPEAEMEAMVWGHLHRLVGSANDIRAE